MRKASDEEYKQIMQNTATLYSVFHEHSQYLNQEAVALFHHLVKQDSSLNPIFSKLFKSLRYQFDNE